MTTLTAIEDAERLVAWAEPNTAVCDEAPVEARLLRALASTGTTELANGVPALRFCDRDVSPVPLLEAVVFDSQTATASCERCDDTGGVHRLLVPMGASVVAFHVCDSCRAALNQTYPGLAWG